MEWLTDLLAGAAGGGLLGIIGSGLTAWGEYSKQKLLFEHQHKMATLEQEELKLEIERDTKIAEVDALKAMEVSADAALGASFVNDKRAYSSSGQSKWFVFVDVLRGIIRPSLTFYSALLMTYIAVKLHNLNQTTLTQVNPDTVWLLYVEVVQAIIFVSTTVILWWFGSRPKKAL